MNTRPERISGPVLWEMPGAMIILPASQRSGFDGWWKRKILRKITKTADRILEQGQWDQVF